MCLVYMYILFEATLVLAFGTSVLLEDSFKNVILFYIVFF